MGIIFGAIMVKMVLTVPPVATSSVYYLVKVGRAPYIRLNVAVMCVIPRRVVYLYTGSAAMHAIPGP
jgi:hypothetical protein